MYCFEFFALEPFLRCIINQTVVGVILTTAVCC